MKLAVLASLIASVAAFAPAQQAKTSTALSASFENELGAQVPLGFWDPLGIVADGDKAKFDRLRFVELKHGRICMLGVVGYLTTAAGIRLPGLISYDGTKFSDIPAGWAGSEAVPYLGAVQVLLFIGFLELFVMKSIEGTGNEFVGDFRNGFIDFGWNTFDADTKLKKRAIELNNGRAAQMGLLALMVHDKLDVSVLPHAFGFQSLKSVRNPVAGIVSLYAESRDENAKGYEFALLFDCDGVILETEELHRLAYNAAFKEFDLTIDGEPVVWSVEYYDVLQNTVGGGKPKMLHHFRNTVKAFPSVGSRPAPATPDQQQALIDDLQEWKTNHFKKLLATEAKARPGVLELMDEALADPRIAVGVCSASSKEAAVKTLDITLGSDRVGRLDVCILGDDVSKRKPDPEIYVEAGKRLGLPSERCVVVEDSLVGLRAAVAANMRCIITYTSSTASMDFYGEGAAAKVPDLASRGVNVASIFDGLRRNGLDAEILPGIKDPASVQV